MEVSAQGLKIGYGDYVAVKEMDIHIPKNKITTIIGPNGSGKSTVLKALTRLLNYQQGSVEVDGKDLMDYASKAFAKKVAVLQQQQNATAEFGVEELVS